jgi:hypothetical protein
MSMNHRYQVMQGLSPAYYEDLKEVVTPELTDAQKREDTWLMDLRQGHLTNARMRTIARRLWQRGWPLYMIANTLGIKESTASCWKKEFSHMDELTQPAIVRRRDGKGYPGTKARRRAAQPESPEGSSPLPSTENDAEAHGIGALQNLSALEVFEDIWQDFLRLRLRLQAFNSTLA